MTLALSSSGCLGEGSVTRLAGGELRVGPAIPIRAYEAFLKGAIAEERGDLVAAAREYRAAISFGPDDPEVWSRLGTALCASSPKAADGAFGEALELDPEFEGALLRRAECAVRRGQKADFFPAFRQNPRRVTTAARAVAAGDGPGVGDAAFALTVAYGEAPAAWEALAAYGRAHGDTRTEVRALAVRAAQDSPGRTLALARSFDLFQRGFTAEARALAGAAVDARSKVGADPGLAAVLEPTKLQIVYRLSLDEALARGDGAALRRRATRTHLGLEEAASRALAAGEDALARDLARAVAEADPASTTARLVGALARPMADPLGSAGPAGDPFAKLTTATRPLPAALLVVLTERVLATGGKDAAQHVFAQLSSAQVFENDDLLLARLVDLVVAGAVPMAALPIEGLVELAVREGGAPRKPPSRLSADAPLDAPHAYLRDALFAPRAETTRALRARVASAHAAVVVGDVLVELAGEPSASRDAAALPRRVVAAGQGTMVLGARVELLRARADAEGVARAQKLLAARGPALTARESGLLTK